MRFCLLYSVFYLLATTQSVDRLVAVVGSEPIFASDVREVERLRLFEPATDAAATDTLARLIDRRLMLVEIARYSPSAPAAAEIEAAEKAWAARFPSDEERARAVSASRNGLLVVRAFLADTLRIETYVTQRFASADRITRDETLRAWLRGLRDRAQIRIIK